MRISILHASDLHGRPDRAVDLRIVTDALFARLEQIQRGADPPISLVCFTGDLAYHGLADEYPFAAANFLDPLLHVLGLGKESLFFVPGNHDVVRVTAGEELDHHNHLLRTLRDRDSVNRLLDNDAERARAFARLRNYADFSQQYLGHLARHGDVVYSLARRVDIASSPIAVACLNSAWRCNSDDDCRHLLLGERQLDRAAEAMGDVALRISLLHHPFSWLCDFEEREAARRLVSQSDLILSGHMHDPEPEVRLTPYGRCLVSATGSTFDGRTLNGFSIIDVDLDSLAGQVHLFRYYDQRRVFDCDLFVADRGVFPFDLGRPLPRSPSAQVEIAARTRVVSGATLMDGAARDRRVVAVFDGVKHKSGGAWLLGVSLNLMEHMPQLQADGSVVPGSLLQGAATDGTVERFVGRLHRIGDELQNSQRAVSDLISELMEIVDAASARWASNPEQIAIRQYDKIVSTMIDHASSEKEMLIATLARADELLDEHRYDAVVELLGSAVGDAQAVRQRLTRALCQLQRYEAVIGVLGALLPDTLSEEEVEDLVWSYCGKARLGDAERLLAHHATRFRTTIARIFRRAVHQQFHDLA